MSNWNKLYEELKVKCDYIKKNPPATNEQIFELEKSLGYKLPNDLKDLLSEMNGDNWFILSTDEIKNTNLSLRNQDFYMSLDCLLFFGKNGCGDYYGYPITKKDDIRDDNVFIWEHEYDNRIWKANNLEEVIIKYYSDEI